MIVALSLFFLIAADLQILTFFENGQFTHAQLWGKITIAYVVP